MRSSESTNKGYKSYGSVLREWRALNQTCRQVGWYAREFSRLLDSFG